MIIRKRGKAFYIDISEPIYPYRRLRQSLGKISESEAWKIGNSLKEAYNESKLNPFIDGFSVLSWYKNGQNQNFILCLDAVKEFLAYKEPFLAKASLKTYKHYLNFWLDNMKIHDQIISLVTPSDIRPIIMRGTTSSKSKDSFKRHLQAFFEFCVKNEWVQTNPVKQISTPKIRASLVDKMLRNDELELLFLTFDNVINHKKNQKRYRDYWSLEWFKPLIAFLRYTGLRREEAVSRKWSHIVDNKVYVEAIKGVRERYVPLSNELMTHFKDYQEKYQTKSEWIFPNPNFINQHITGERVYRAFKEYCKIARIDERRSIHGLRHAAISSWISEKGLSTREAQILAGHSSITTTEKYAHLDIDNIAKKMNKNLNQRKLRQ